MTPVVHRLTKQDVEICKAFRSVVLQGKFEVQGEALAKVGALFRWFSDLDLRIDETLKPLPPPVLITPEPEKKKK